MPVKHLDHVNIHTRQMAETIRFYSELLGLKVGVTPGRSDTSMSAWLYDEGGRPIVHLGTPKGDGPEAPPGSGRIDHVAFECSGHDETAQRLTEWGLPFRRREVAEVKLRQLFVRDPNDIMVELNFR